MAILEILQYPDPRLAHPAQRVEKIDDATRRLIDDIERDRFDGSGLWDGNMSSFEDLRPEIARLLELGGQ